MWTLLFLCFVARSFAQNAEAGGEFAPIVTATCKTGLMSIKIKLNQPFNGLAHAREFRTPACMAYGNGGDTLTLDINLMAPNGTPDFCGVLINNRTEERSVPLAVRVHRTLELADDKFYIITCGNGFQNSFNETSTVSLRLLNDHGVKVMNAAFGLPYMLKAEIINPDGLHGLRMKDCKAFNMKNVSVPLLDNRGCPVHESLSEAKQEVSTSEVTIKSMFRFSDTSQVNFQCEIIICRARCSLPDCKDDKEPTNDVIESTYTVSTGAFVLDPTDSAILTAACQEGGIRPPWLLYLTIALGVMFLIMLLINCFLCTAMTCSCARTEVLEKDPSVVEDYDPYRSWHGSQYGSRYPSSTIHSARSVSDNSDHYAIVQSRPGSRHSGMHRSRH